MPNAEIQALLEAALDGLTVPAPPEAAPRLAALAAMLESWGGRMNLTGHQTATEIARLLIADAIGLLGALERHAAVTLSGRVVDLGSGAGFPGLPFAVIRPSAEVHMVEARQKRHFFQRAVRRELHLSNAHPIHARIEDHPIAEADWVVAQAVGPIGEMIHAMEPYAQAGGRLAVPGSDRLVAPTGVEGFSGEVVEYRSATTGASRRVWIGRPPGTTQG